MFFDYLGVSAGKVDNGCVLANAPVLLENGVLHQGNGCRLVKNARPWSWTQGTPSPEPSTFESGAICILFVTVFENKS